MGFGLVQGRRRAVRDGFQDVSGERSPLALSAGTMAQARAGEGPSVSRATWRAAVRIPEEL